jgi:hypothetical protein
VTGKTGGVIHGITRTRASGSSRGGCGGRYRTNVYLANGPDIFLYLELLTGIRLRRLIEAIGGQVGKEKEDKGNNYQYRKYAYKITEKYSVFVAHLNPPEFN